MLELLADRCETKSPELTRCFCSALHLESESSVLGLLLELLNFAIESSTSYLSNRSSAPELHASPKARSLSAVPVIP